jgi:hypothetical protein
MASGRATPVSRKGIGETRRSLNKPRLREAQSVEVEHSSEVIVELGIVPHPILGQHKCQALSFGAGSRHHDDVAHRSNSLLIKAIEEGSNQCGDLRRGVFLQEMAAGDCAGHPHAAAIA